MSLKKPARLVVLVSGSGTNLQAILTATQSLDFAAQVVAVGADRDQIAGLARADAAEVPTFVLPVSQFSSREHWDRALADRVAAFEPDLVVLAGFMKLVGAEFLSRFPNRVWNTHPALSPAFPGVSGPADALAYGVKITGASLFVVDAGVDTGAIIDQVSVPVHNNDSVSSLHERIKVVEREMLVRNIVRASKYGYQIQGRKVLFGDE